MSPLHNRSTQEVFADHLRLSLQGTVEEDATRNYAEDVVLLTGQGIYRGHAGLKELARQLQEQLPDCSFEYHTQQVEREMAFLEWSGHSASSKARIEDGADSFLIRNGKIIAQTIHYRLIQDQRT